MNEIKETLAELFNEMLKETPHFKRKTYEPTFESMMDKYRGPLLLLADEFTDLDEDAAAALEAEYAEVIPALAQQQLGGLGKRKKDNAAIDYNMNMAVYVIPCLCHLKNEHWDNIAGQTVKKWNEQKVTDLTLGQSSYESISGGFKKRLCFITTAVCESRHLADDCYELETLRNYRDTYLQTSESGRALVDEYYETAPLLVSLMNMQPEHDRLYEQLYRDYISPCVRDIEAGRYAACEHKYETMVRRLQRQYLPS